jgi:rfaE bifunctional protein nucleotidyltransferase chain/domain
MSKFDKIQSKVLSLDELIKQVESWKEGGDKIVFTNGCFDILHKGHVEYLAKAADFGRKLIVAVNSDDSVKRLGKDKNRPIQDENSRALIIASLEVVDAVIIFNEDTPNELIKAILPDVLVKGGDYNPEETNSSSKTYIVGSDVVRQKGGEVKIISLVEGYSTTNIVSKLKD